MQMECRRQLLQGEPPPPAEETGQGQGDLGWSERRRGPWEKRGWGVGQEEAVPQEALQKDLISQRLGHWRFPLKTRRGKEYSVHPEASEGIFVPRKRIKTGKC